jgi:hypothetical protein
MIAAAEELLANMKTTAGCRFGAHKRLEERDQSLTRLTAFTSAYLMALTILPYVLKLPSASTDRVNLLAIFCGLVVLVSSLLQYSGRDGVNAEQFHRCALEINELRRKMKARAEELCIDETEGYADGYNAILQKYSVNHDEIDYRKYQLDRPEEFTWLSRGTRFRYHVEQFRAKSIPNLALAIVTIAVIWVSIQYAIPYPVAPVAAGG